MFWTQWKLVPNESNNGNLHSWWQMPFLFAKFGIGCGRNSEINRLQHLLAEKQPQIDDQKSAEHAKTTTTYSILFQQKPTANFTRTQQVEMYPIFQTKCFHFSVNSMLRARQFLYPLANANSKFPDFIMLQRRRINSKQ